MRKKISIGLSILSIAFLAHVFTNCSAGLPAINDKSSMENASGKLALSGDTHQVYVGKTVQLSVSNGTPPYEFDVYPPSRGSINPQTLLFTASQAGATTITVIDGANTWSEFVLNVVSDSTEQSCTAPWGDVIAGGSSVKAYFIQSDPSCPSEDRTCTNGNLSGAFQFENCTLTSGGSTATSCNLPWGGTVANGASVSAFPTSSAPVCTPEVRTCDNGSLSGSHQHKDCTPTSSPSSCGLPAAWGGGSIATGASIKAFKFRVSEDCSANSETRVCNNGALSGDFIYKACRLPKDCSFLGRTVEHGDSVRMYAPTSRGTCTSELRVCQDGSFDGSYPYYSCSSAINSTTREYGGGDN